MSDAIVFPVEIVRVDSVAGTIAENDQGEVFAYLTLRNGDQVLNVAIPTSHAACNMSALLLDIADNLA